MKIGVTGPVSILPLAIHIDNWDEPPEGIEFAYITTLIEGLLARGHTLHVFTLNPHVASARTYSGPNLTIEVLPMRPRARHHLSDLYRKERNLLRDAINASDCDLIHAHWTYEFGWAATRSNKKNIVTAHDPPWMIARLYRGGRWWLRALLAQRVVPHANALTAVSPNVRDHLMKWMRPKVGVKLIPNGLAPSGLEPRGETRDKAAPVFAVVAQYFSRRKNTAAAFAALHELRKTVPGARLLAIGIEHERDGQAQQWAKAHGFDQNVDWIGPISNAQVGSTLQNLVDVLVHPSLNESCSIAIMEAQNLGLPVIGGYDSGGVEFSLLDGVAGSLTDVRNPTAVANAMRALIENQDQYSQLSQAGLDAIKETFNLAKTLDLYEDAYWELTHTQ